VIDLREEENASDSICVNLESVSNEIDEISAFVSLLLFAQLTLCLGNCRPPDWSPERPVKTSLRKQHQFKTELLAKPCEQTGFGRNSGFGDFKAIGD
jgi:hypothetical protein